MSEHNSNYASDEAPEEELNPLTTTGQRRRKAFTRMMDNDPSAGFMWESFEMGADLSGDERNIQPANPAPRPEMETPQSTGTGLSGLLGSAEIPIPAQSSIDQKSAIAGLFGTAEVPIPQPVEQKAAMDQLLSATGEWNLPKAIMDIARKHEEVQQELLTPVSAVPASHGPHLPWNAPRSSAVVSSSSISAGSPSVSGASRQFSAPPRAAVSAAPPSMGTPTTPAALSGGPFATAPPPPSFSAPTAPSALSGPQQVVPAPAQPAPPPAPALARPAAPTNPPAPAPPTPPAAPPPAPAARAPGGALPRPTALGTRSTGARSSVPPPAPGTSSSTSPVPARPAPPAAPPMPTRNAVPEKPPAPPAPPVVPQSPQTQEEPQSPWAAPDNDSDPAQAAVPQRPEPFVPSLPEDSSVMAVQPELAPQAPRERSRIPLLSEEFERPVLPAETPSAKSVLEEPDTIPAPTVAPSRPAQVAFRGPAPLPHETPVSDSIPFQFSEDDAVESEPPRQMANEVSMPPSPEPVAQPIQPQPQFAQQAQEPPYAGNEGDYLDSAAQPMTLHPEQFSTGARRSMRRADFTKPRLDHIPVKPPEEVFVPQPRNWKQRFQDLWEDLKAAFIRFIS